MDFNASKQTGKKAGGHIMRRTMVAVAAVLAVAIMCGSAAGFTYGELGYGNAVRAADARFLALGGAGLASADGARGLGLNPALVAKTEGIELAITGSFLTAEESRSKPVHDSFDGIIVDNVYALNTSLYDNYFGAVAWQPTGDFDWAPAVALGYAPRLDMNYNYHVQYRDPDTQAEPADKILYDYFLESDGAINAFSIGLAQEIAEEIYVGVGVDLLRGEYNVEERWVYPIGSDEEDVDGAAVFDGVSGTQFTFGLLVEKLSRVDVALVYRSSAELSGDYSIRAADADSTTRGTFDYTYPDAVGLGLQYHPRNELLTTVNLDIEYTRWSEFEDSFIDDPELDDTIEYRLGVEHVFYNETSARFGFMYAPSYFDESTTMSAFSAGVGLDIMGMRVDVGGQIGTREYNLDDSRVRETNTTLAATLVHRF